MNRLAALAALTLAALAAAADKKDWKTGRVADVQVGPSSYVNVGGRSTTEVQPDGEAQTRHSTRIIERHDTRVFLVGDGFTYTLSNPVRGFMSSYASCRFIVGDDVKYRQDKATMHLIDADGKECTGEIVRQERVSSPEPRP